MYECDVMKETDVNVWRWPVEFKNIQSQTHFIMYQIMQFDMNFFALYFLINGKLCLQFICCLLMYEKFKKFISYTKYWQWHDQNHSSRYKLELNYYK